LAFKHAENEGIGVGKLLGELVDGARKGCLHLVAGGSLLVCKYLLEELKLDVDPKDKY
ncbi:hypothetical protein MKW94_014876, partial [Papaver nudicaule]|nr:hypothetical protein [Papaver nudicaule]